MPRGICQDCGEEHWLHRHHLKLRVQGGTDADGVVLICGSCHDDRHGGPWGGTASRTPEARAKLSAALRGRKLSAEQRARISASHKGRPWSPKRRAAADRRFNELMEVARMGAKINSTGMALLTTDDVAAMLGIGTQRVRRLAAQGRIKGTKAGRDWVFEERDVKKFAELPRLSGGAGHRNYKKQAAVA